jgi:hypothetical protein
VESYPKPEADCGRDPAFLLPYYTRLLMPSWLVRVFSFGTSVYR